jgi:hypothetical protein
MTPILRRGLGLASHAIPEAIGTLLPGFSGQSFEALEAFSLRPSDFVPKLTSFETNRARAGLAAAVAV